MSTFQNVVDRARVPLNDADKVRYPDADLIQGANKAMGLLRMRRPDLFFGTYATPLAAYTLADTFPLEEQFRPAVEDYITAWAEMRDDEAAIEARAKVFFKMFGEQL